jgi:parvulin-like peptidyl-prolyl isomerase
MGKAIKRNKYIIMIMVGVISWLGYGISPAFAADKIVAKVDKEVITQIDFSNEWSSIDRSDITTSTTISVQEEKMKVLNLLVDRRILFNQIKKENIKVDPRLIDQEIAAEKMTYKSEAEFNKMLQNKKFTMKEYRDYLEGTLQMQQLLIKHVYSQLTVTNAELEQYYALHSTRYFTPEQVKLRSIFIKVPATATAEEKGDKLAKAKLALLKIKLGSAFEDIARSNSDSENAIRGGDAGYVTRGMLQRTPELANAAFSLSVGEFSDVIETKFGFYILKVEGLVAGRGKRFWEVRDQIQKDLTRDRATEEYNQFVEDLRKQSQIELFPENLP